MIEFDRINKDCLNLSTDYLVFWCVLKGTDSVIISDPSPVLVGFDFSHIVFESFTIFIFVLWNED